MKWAAGVWFGSGTQVMSWIHLRDLVGLIYFAIQQPHMEGIYNAVANEPCSQEYFIRYLSKYMRRLVLPFGVPDYVAKLFLGEMAQLVLEGSSIVSTRLNKTGFRLKYPYLYDALRELTKPKRSY
jgi:NAD dependent epimerase/dehydratase family enzyme